MKHLTAALLIAIITVFSFPAYAHETKGPEIIEIYGGKRGNITLPHREHQDFLMDCMPCHRLFPMEKGGIASMIEAKKNKKKTVMNKACIACHKKNKKEGKDYGPISCKDCHIKKK